MLTLFTMDKFIQVVELLEWKDTASLFTTMKTITPFSERKAVVFHIIPTRTGFKLRAHAGVASSEEELTKIVNHFLLDFKEEHFVFVQNFTCFQVNIQTSTGGAVYRVINGKINILCIIDGTVENETYTENKQDSAVAISDYFKGKNVDSRRAS